MFVDGFNINKKLTSSHGTKMAGVAISKTYGVAKEATAIALGVGNDQGEIKNE